MTTAIEFIFVVTAVVGVLAGLGWIIERFGREDPLEKLERRFPRTKGWER
jgi:hypothetical protein